MCSHYILLNFGNSQSYTANNGSFVSCNSCVRFLTRNWLTENALWASSLFWWLNSRFFKHCFPQTFVIFKWYCKICPTVSLFMLTILAIIRMRNSQYFWNVIVSFRGTRTTHKLIVFNGPQEIICATVPLENTWS